MAWIDSSEGTPISKDWGRDDDVRLAAFYQTHKIPVFVAVPHPVEHIGDELGSTLGHNGPAAKRRARVWLGEQGLGAHLNWANLQHVKE